MPGIGEVPLHVCAPSLPVGADVGDTDLKSGKMSIKSANTQAVSKPKKKKRSWKKPIQTPCHQTPNPSLTASSQTPILIADSSIPKLRMDQIIGSPRLSHPGSNASSVRKWDHSLFINQNPTPRLAYRPFKEVLPKNIPPRPRLPPAFPVQQLPAKRKKVPPTAPRLHTTLSESSIPIRPEPRSSWQERSVSASTSTIPERMEAGAVTPGAQTSTLSRDDGSEIQMLERQVQSLTARLSNCQNELQDMRVKLDFANMTAGRGGANLGNARREIKELKDRIKELEYPAVEVKVEDDAV
ncbi:hypothetical protein I203_105675 [Kwoniella mangroviensis CBS 8507]|uniref:uncharacterized protein n=1 Tax=Kwoniella mangroviensis CBS 8507 TaxID=1296122 RepID=UPI00080D1E92|nr:uncharacterized protein I203_01487 [Kwoniella mangroviensis CBS 8507]OCF69623.1 hypothetical protein I203_01487 [Kwoniella mangroviensis CBS 8507]